MTKQEVLAELSRLSEETIAKQKQLREIEKQENLEAGTRLKALVGEIEALIEEAIDMANENELEFSLDWSQGSWEFESWAPHNWNQSTC
jgi:N-methylhydantoinase A/oxoprolinase/acetone carboxylase beta subunit